MKDENHICIHGWMVNQLHLTGNDLICYALIFGFSQDDESEFSGSLKYVAESVGISKDRARILLKNLSESGLLIKRDEVINGVKFCKYSVNYDIIKTSTVCVKHVRGMRETSIGGMRETRTNNINIDNIKESKETSPKGEEKKDELSLSHSSNSIDFKAFLDYFNTRFAGKLPAIRTMNEARRKAVKARAAEYGKKSVFDVLEKVASSPFLLGNNERNWICDFNWIFKPNNFVKILEGSYDKSANTDTAAGRKKSVESLADLAVAVLQGTAAKNDR